MTQLSHRMQREITKQVQINYLLYLPDKYGKDPEAKWPLLLFLHGAGERGHDIELVKRHGPPKLAEKGEKLPFVIVSPQCPEESLWEIERDALIALLDDVCETYRIDESKIYVTGLSMGGVGTWNLAANYPNKFAAIAPICGGGNPKQAVQLTHTPIWAFHGAKDAIIPAEKSSEMVDAANAAGGNAKLTIYPNANHDSWTETYQNSELYQWLLSHSKPASTSEANEK
ncbi:prolyl oligopeptidase family serine peptidase [Paenibacillus popilliae]|uniref:Phospholipase n=1 Tax=Paenibacillus popilliae TaxID=78057 RepID=A0ABY3AQU1_PAEPP|nr:prolyl oligopeptidase family serine peptidase [Paenibacillus sp. SDF0028]TQR44381.1 phospholipase [Paenibacillus sp. SDF0028]